MWHGDDAILPADYGYADAYGDCGCGCKGAPSGCGGGVVTKPGEYGVVITAAMLAAAGKGLLAVAPAALGLFGSMAGSKAQQQQAAASCPQVANIDAQIQAIKDSRGLLAKLIHTPWGEKQKQIDALEAQRPGAFVACQQAATFQSLPVSAPPADPMGGININYLLLGGLALVAVFALRKNDK
jgi:hypothetical protein